MSRVSLFQLARWAGDQAPAPSVAIALYLAAAKSYGFARADSLVLITSFVPEGQKEVPESMAFLVALISFCDFSFFLLQFDNNLANLLQ